MSVLPAAAWVAPLGTRTFTAEVTGTSDAAVTWSVQEGNAGGQVSAGLYAAPATPGTYHVVATSVADASRQGVATVTVSDDFAARFEMPSETLPVIIGEFGPASGSMTLDDTAAPMASAEAHGVPYLAWTFHMRCPPNLLVDDSAGGCGVGMTLEPTAWGTQLKERLAMPW